MGNITSKNRSKPTICWTHPRSTSTAFERVFMHRNDIKAFHEPYGDPFYWGPERMSPRFSDEECAGHPDAKTSFADITQRLLEGSKKARAEGKTVWIKDMAQYIVPPITKNESTAPKGVAPSFGSVRTEEQNATVIPIKLLKEFRHTFLIRLPVKSVASYYNCTIPPLSERTGFSFFLPEEAGYRELLILYNMLKSTGLETEIVLIDSDDLLDFPNEIIPGYCKAIGIPYNPKMLEWGDKGEGCEAFKKWDGFHDDALKSTGFKERLNKSSSGPYGTQVKHMEQEDVDGWKETFGDEAAEVIKDTVESNMQTYASLKNLVTRF